MFAGLESNDLVANGRYESIDFQQFTYLAKKFSLAFLEIFVYFPKPQQSLCRLYKTDVGNP